MRGRGERGGRRGRAGGRGAPQAGGRGPPPPAPSNGRLLLSGLLLSILLMSRLQCVDVVPVLSALGTRKNLLRLHFGAATPPCPGTVYVCRRQVENLLSSATDKTFQRAAKRVLDTDGGSSSDSETPTSADPGSEHAKLPSVLLVNECELQFLKKAKVWVVLGPRAPPSTALDPPCRPNLTARLPYAGGSLNGLHAVGSAALERQPRARSHA